LRNLSAVLAEMARVCTNVNTWLLAVQVELEKPEPSVTGDRTPIVVAIGVRHFGDLRAALIVGEHLVHLVALVVVIDAVTLSADMPAEHQEDLVVLADEVI